MARTMGWAVPAALVLLLGQSPARGTESAQIQNAVEQGVRYLKGLQGPDGTWPYPQIGATALAGLTLLECGLSPRDAAIQKAADAVRRNSLEETRTYSLSLSILFLDRLGEPADARFIESMAVRLLAGQGDTGGWTYACPAISTEEVRRLQTHLNNRPRLNTRAQAPKTSKTPNEAKTLRDLPLEIQQQLVAVVRQPRFPGQASDNSNTQFATLALWVARRYGIPVEDAVRRLELRFRGSQNPDGGWAYQVNSPSSTGAMTCAGLLALAVVHGTALRNVPGTPAHAGGVATPHDPIKDRAVKAALRVLGTAIGRPAGDEPRRRIPVVNGGRAFYALWSIERVGVIYGLKTIGKKDWYAWGSEILVAGQAADGSWQGEFSAAGADTCFALLFLKRANLAADLTGKFKGLQDPGEVSMRAGGVGGEGLQPSKKPSAIPLAGTEGAKPSGREPVRPSGRPSATVTKPAEKVRDPAPTRADEPPAAVEPGADAARLRIQLLKAPEEQQGALINEFEAGRGARYTEALARAIPELDEPARRKARDALARRLTRMTAETVREKLLDDDAEVRRAAALACAMKQDRRYVPQLIGALEDREPEVVRAARTALKSLTEKDFGPPANANAGQRAAAVAAWKSWWKKQEARSESARERDQ